MSRRGTGAHGAVPLPRELVQPVRGMLRLQLNFCLGVLLVLYREVGAVAEATDGRDRLMSGLHVPRREAIQKIVEAFRSILAHFETRFACTINFINLYY